MCEILLRIYDKYQTKGDPLSDSMNERRGDVIHIAPDGWQWGAGEKGTVHTPWNGNHNFWRILALPNVSIDKAVYLVQEEIPVGQDHPKQLLRFRGFYIDIDALPADIKDYIGDDLRKQPIFTSRMGVVEFNSYVKKKALLPFATMNRVF